MLSFLKRSYYKIIRNPKLFAVLISGPILICIGAMYEYDQSHEHTYWLNVLYSSLSHIGGILLIAFVFALFFDYAERLELANLIAERLRFMATASRAGIKEFELDPRVLSHEREFETSELLTVCIRGSKQFFENPARINLLTRRLRSGKAFNVICHKDNLDKLYEVKSDIFNSGINVDKFLIFTHDCELMYNFLVADEGIWIKSYFINRRPYNYAAPAFFVETDTPLWKRYKDDIDNVTRIGAP